MKTLLAFALSAMTLGALPAPPPFPAGLAQPATTTYFGATVADPYRGLERLNDPGVQRWFKAQANYTNDVLGKLGAPREALRRRIRALSAAGAGVGSIALADSRVIYLERPAGGNAYRLMVRGRAAGSPKRLLLDPERLQAQAHSRVHQTISFVVPSPDASAIAVGLVPGGAEPRTVVRVVQTATGKLLDDALPRAWFGVTGWIDNTTFLYNQLPQLRPGESENDLELRSHVLRHTIGQPASSDVAIFGDGVDPNVPFVPTDSPSIATDPSSDYAIGTIGHGVLNEQTLYVAPKSALSSVPIPWRKIADVRDAVTGFALHGSQLFLLTHKNAPRFRVTALDLTDSAATAASAAPFVAQSAAVLHQIAAASDTLFLRDTLQGLGQLRRVALAAPAGGGATATANIAPVALPFTGAIDQISTDTRLPGAIVALESWTKPAAVFDYDGNVFHDIRLVAPPAIDTSPYTSIETQYPSTDGAIVPISIVMRKDTKRDGTAPMDLEGYGSYGLSIDPAFTQERLAFLDAGGIYAAAHVRGGGENGEDWHLAGKGPTKIHTIDDVVAAARFLIAQQYSSAAHLGVEGTSAGGIPLTGSITRHPELFAAALDVVGSGNQLRAEASPNGASNVPEFGSVATKAGFQGLFVMDGYSHVVNRTAYPAVMGITGINDPRVAPWEVAKFIARVQHATSSGRPVLMRVDYDAGHGLLGASQEQTVALLTDEYSFLLWQCGSPRFQTVPRTYSH